MINMCTMPSAIHVATIKHHKPSYTTNIGTSININPSGQQEYVENRKNPRNFRTELILINLSRPKFNLTHRGRVAHICVGKRTIIGSDNGLSPSHYLNLWWNIVNWTLRNKLQRKFNRNSNIFIQENALENIVCEMASILSRPQWVKDVLPVWKYKCGD